MKPTKPASNRRGHYPESFKREAVEYLIESGKSYLQVSKELGVNDVTLAKWRRRYAGDPSIKTTDPTMSTEVRTAKLTEAELLLMDGYERLEKVCAKSICQRDTIERFVRLYDVEERPDKRSEWRQKLELFDKTHDL